jgi:twitching motility two-component system response regulator PilH
MLANPSDSLSLGQKRKNRIKPLLIIDNSPIQTHIIKTLLGKSQISLSVTNNAEEAIAKAHEIKLDLILMDIVMLGKTGFQATQDLSRKLETSIIRVVNTKNHETDKIWAMRQGAKNYRVKSVKEKDLMESIDKALS